MSDDAERVEQLARQLVREGYLDTMRDARLAAVQIIVSADALSRQDDDEPEQTGTS